jgi:hypothetical protein
MKLDSLDTGYQMENFGQYIKTSSEDHPVLYLWVYCFSISIIANIYGN